MREGLIPERTFFCLRDFVLRPPPPPSSGGGGGGGSSGDDERDDDRAPPDAQRLAAVVRDIGRTVLVADGPWRDPGALRRAWCLWAVALLGGDEQGGGGGGGGDGGALDVIFSAPQEEESFRKALAEVRRGARPPAPWSCDATGVWAVSSSRPERGSRRSVVRMDASDRSPRLSSRVVEFPSKGGLCRWRAVRIRRRVARGSVRASWRLLFERRGG